MKTWFNMEFSDLVKNRRSTHFFTDEPVSDEDLNYILEAARWAPSAGNSQPWQFIIARKPENIQKIWETTKGITYNITKNKTIRINPQNFIKKASVIIIVITDPTAYKGKQSSVKSDLYSIQDSANATMCLLLAAANRGLGACWVGMFHEEKLQEALNIPSHIRPVAIVPIGHTKSQEKPRPRKPLKQLMHYEAYQQR
jgi:nitroreductase